MLSIAHRNKNDTQCFNCFCIIRNCSYDVAQIEEYVTYVTEILF